MGTVSGMGIVVSLLNLVSLLFLARAILSWFQVRPGSPIYPLVDGVYRLTEPILTPVRRLLPPMGGFDLSIFIVILGIQWILVPLARSI